MSLKNFSILFKEFDSNNSTNKKVRILIEYFLTNNSLDNSWTIYLLIGKNNKRFISGKLLRNYFSEIYSMPLWLIENCYTKVGDSAEVVALLLNNINFKNDIKEDISLEKLMRFHLPKLYSISDNEKKLYLKECWKNLSKEDFLIFNKILTGTFRVGVSRGLVTKALSSITEIEESIIAHRLMGKFEPSIKNFEFLTNKLTDQKELDYRPFPFQLANSFDEKILFFIILNT